MIICVDTHGRFLDVNKQAEEVFGFKPDELIDWTPAAQGWVYDLTKGSPE